MRFRSCGVFFALLVHPVTTSVFAEGTADRTFADEAIVRSGSTVFQETFRTATAAASGGVVPRVATTGLYYAGYKAGADLVEYAYRRSRGQEGRLPDLTEVSVTAAGATVGSLVGSSVAGPVGGWVGQWVGWSFGETLAGRARRGEGWDPAGALGEMDLPKLVAAAVTTEAAGYAALRVAGLNPSLPAVGASPARVAVGLAAKVLAMSTVTTAFGPAYQSVAGIHRTEVTTSAAAAPATDRRDGYRRLLEDLRTGNVDRARDSLKSYQGAKEP